jgi:hypothetical protein
MESVPSRGLAAAASDFNPDPQGQLILHEAVKRVAV